MTKQYKRAARLTMPIFSCAHDKHMMIHVVGEICQTTMPGLSSDSDKPVEVMRVVNMETGEEGNLLVLAILKSSLEREEDGYVGKDYEVVTGDTVVGKKYRAIDIYRLESSGK